MVQKTGIDINKLYAVMKEMKADAGKPVDKRMTPYRTEFNYKTYTFMNNGVIPGNKGNGILVEGYLIRNGTWILLGSQLSLDKKKDFYDVPGGPIEIRQGDVVAVRCLYINNGSEPVNFGMSEGEEMCGFQLDIGYNPADADLFKRPPTCRTEAPTFKFCHFPATYGLC